MPRQTRHVWVTGARPIDPPVQALVLGWRRRGGRWAALVVLMVEPGHDGLNEPMVVQRWYPAERLMPVPADFNNLSDRLKLYRASRASRP